MTAAPRTPAVNGAFLLHVAVAADVDLRFLIVPLGDAQAPAQLRLISQSTQVETVYAPWPPLP